jgi:predicted GNAT superfamily acetyltransferase
MSIEIRPLAGLREYAACEQLQRAVWGDFGLVPDHMLLTVQRNGGLVLGAFDHEAAETPLVGFVFGFLGRSADGQLKHASHMAAVLSAYRDCGLGARLKWAQRDHALAQGLTLMSWTFDPLLSRNAQLNITRLGATCRTYIRNIYGPEPENLHGELPSDRFLVEWRLTDEQVVARRTGLATPPGAAALRARAPLANPDPREPSEEPIGNAFLIQIPADLEALKVTDLARARAWRYQVRALAETAFAAGFAVSAFARDDEVGLFLLERT